MVMDGYWSSLQRARITRRRMIAGGITIAAVTGATTVVGCSGGDNQRNDRTPRSGGVLRTGTTLPLSSGLDPHLEAGTGLAIFPRVYGYLFHIDPRDDTVIKDHAESIEQPDALTYLVRIRPDVRYQAGSPTNGRAVTAEDAARSILRYRDNQIVTNRTFHATVLDRAEAVDARTLRVTTKRPYAYTLQALGDINAGAIIPKDLIDSQASLAFSGIGSGPFAIDRVSRQDGARISRNDKYFRTPLPYLDAMEWTVFKDAEARVAAFQRKEIDAMPNDDTNEARKLRESSTEIEVTASPSLAYLSLGLRVDRPPFNDLRIRGAVDLALDRDAMIRDLTFGEGEVLGPVNPHLASGFWSSSASDLNAGSSGNVAIDERRAGARALLIAAGADKAAFKLQVAGIPQLIDVATVVRDHLQRIGLTVTLEELDLLTWYANLRSGDFEATLVSQFPWESPDIPTRWYHSKGPEGTTSPFGYANGTIDTLLERSWGEDRTTRRTTLLEAQRLMIIERPMLQLFTSVGYSSAWSYVRNRQADLPASLPQFVYEQWIERG